MNRRSSAFQPVQSDLAVHLFKTDAKPEWLEFCTLDAAYGWGAFAERGVTSADVKGAHTDVFDAAHVPGLAEQVRASLA